jgi:hypothetical protein
VTDLLGQWVVATQPALKEAPGHTVGRLLMVDTLDSIMAYFVECDIAHAWGKLDSAVRGECCIADLPRDLHGGWYARVALPTPEELAAAQLSQSVTL